MVPDGVVPEGGPVVLVAAEHEVSEGHLLEGRCGVIFLSSRLEKA